MSRQRLTARGEAVALWLLAMGGVGVFAALDWAVAR